MNILIRFKDGHKEIHAKGILDDSYTLCGFDTIGDSDWEHGIPTNEKINCLQCINIVLYCKKFKKGEINGK